MCGIAGQISLSGKKVTLSQVESMTNAIAHRGPDGFGHWLDSEEQVCLGHRRLSIIDLSNFGDQPMHYLDRYTIVFNGEIYNYIEIKQQLLTLGYTFRSNSDTEVLLALYDHKKSKCLEDLEGMFAFVIYDKVEKKIFIARDRFGEKPFFYKVEDGIFYFASEIKAFWANGLSKEMDMETAFYFLNYGRVHHPTDRERTFFKEIFKLKPSHSIEIQRGVKEIIQKEYWSLPSDELKESDLIVDNVKEEFFHLFEASIKRRLRSDVPIGSSLSGGLDSSAVVCMIDYLNKGQNFSQNTFSARFPGFAKDEGQFMELVLNKTNATPYYTFPDKEGFIENFQKLCFHQDEPFGSASIYAQYEVMRLAKENNVTVLLDGQGADELLGGYMFYANTYNRELYGDNVVNTIQSKGSIKNLIKSTFSGAYKRYLDKKIEKSYKDNLLKNGYSHQFVEFASKLSEPNEIHYSLNKHLGHDLMNGNLEDLLRYADRNSMAHSREVRLPFLDKNLVEFLMKLPSSYKIRNNWSKWIQREAFKNILPEEITWRTDKIGYEPPQKDWMKDDRVKEVIVEGKRKLLKAGIITKKESERNPEAVNANAINDNSWYQLMIASYIN